MNDNLFCVDCLRKDKIYPIIEQTKVLVICSSCLAKREESQKIKESGRVDIEIKNYTLTVKGLRESLAGVPDSTPVLYQRIEDQYFLKHGWRTEEMEFEHNSMSDYIGAFSSYWHYKKNAFVINAHY